jgi:hypothetical protein
VGLHDGADGGGELGLVSPEDGVHSVPLRVGEVELGVELAQVFVNGRGDVALAVLPVSAAAVEPVKAEWKPVATSAPRLVGGVKDSGASNCAGRDKDGTPDRLTHHCSPKRVRRGVRLYT